MVLSETPYSAEIGEIVSSARGRRCFGGLWVLGDEVGAGAGGVVSAVAPDAAGWKAAIRTGSGGRV